MLLIQPKSAKDEVVGLQEERLKIKITAPPVDGKANAHLQKLLGNWFGVAKSNIVIKSGDTGRRKTIIVQSYRQLPPAVAELIKAAEPMQ